MRMCTTPTCICILLNILAPPTPFRSPRMANHSISCFHVWIWLYNASCKPFLFIYTLDEHVYLRTWGSQYQPIRWYNWILLHEYGIHVAVLALDPLHFLLNTTLTSVSRNRICSFWVGITWTDRRLGYCWLSSSDVIMSFVELVANDFSLVLLSLSCSRTISLSGKRAVRYAKLSWFTSIFVLQKETHTVDYESILAMMYSK